MLTLIVLLVAALYAGVRLLTFVYYKKHDISLAQIDEALAGRFKEVSHESKKTHPID
ncbi:MULTISPECIES: hypothetical protein [Paenibacillus]|uniref:hypothetical protein n=1 Tax=Paenibacillus TaxID=44249 RepID=UPI0013DF1CEE|nr:MULTISPECIES: hypothetical protein [Paenibacillus]